MADLNRFETAASLMNAVLRAMGLPVPINYVGSSDPTAVQLLQLFNDLGQELAKGHEWNIFNKTWEFTTTPPTKNYDVPTDLDYFVDSTGWNRTARIPLIGPLTDQQMQLLIARDLGGTTLYMQFQHSNDQLQFYFVPDTAQDIAIGYFGRGWCQDAGTSTIYRDYIDADEDVVLFDPLLIKKGLRLKWRESKGFDTTKLKVEFDDYLDTVKGKDKSNPRLNISRSARYPYITINNLPDTGYGTSS